MADAASDPSVDANPNPNPGETPEGSTVGPQPTEDGNVAHSPDEVVTDTGPKAGPNSEGQVQDSGVQTSDDLK